MGFGAALEDFDRDGGGRVCVGASDCDGDIIGRRRRALSKARERDGAGFRAVHTSVVGERIRHIVAVEADELVADRFGCGGDDLDVAVRRAGGGTVGVYVYLVPAGADVQDDGDRPGGDVLGVDGVGGLLRVVDEMDGGGDDDAGEDRHYGNDDEELHEGEALFSVMGCRLADGHGAPIGATPKQMGTG